MTLPHPNPRPLITLLGSGVVVAITGWMGPLDGATQEADGQPTSAAPWDDSPTLAQVLAASASSDGRLAQPRVFAAVPDAVVSPLGRTTVRRGPVRLGMTLPPMVCLVESSETWDVLPEPPTTSAVSHSCATRHGYRPRLAPIPFPRVAAHHGDRYRLAPKGSPPV